MKHLFKTMILGANLLTATFACAQEKVTVGGGPVAEVPQFIVASDRKLWDSRGLNVVVTPFATGRESFEALIGGQLDLAIMAEFPAVVGAMRDQKFAVVGVLSRYVSNRIIAKSDKPMSIADLAGKPVGVTIGTNTHFMLDEAVRKAGIKIETVNVGPPRRFRAFTSAPSGRSARAIKRSRFPATPRHFCSSLLKTSSQSAPTPSPRFYRP
jgi:NitT/TauT family transport system substrate-binding protein